MTQEGTYPEYFTVTRETREEKTPEGALRLIDLNAETGVIRITTFTPTEKPESLIELRLSDRDPSKAVYTAWGYNPDNGEPIGSTVRHNVHVADITKKGEVIFNGNARSEQINLSLMEGFINLLNRKQALKEARPTFKNGGVVFRSSTPLKELTK